MPSDIKRAPTGIRFFRALAGDVAEEDDFLSPAAMGLAGPGPNAETDTVLKHYGASVFSSLDTLLDRRPSRFVAEVVVTRSGLLTAKTGQDPDHYDLVGDRGDMVECVTRVLEP